MSTLVGLSVCLSVCPSVRLSVCMSVCGKKLKMGQQPDLKLNLKTKFVGLVK